MTTYFGDVLKYLILQVSEVNLSIGSGTVVLQEELWNVVPLQRHWHIP